MTFCHQQIWSKLIAALKKLFFRFLYYAIQIYALLVFIEVLIKNLRLRYIAAISLIALMITVSWLWLTKLINDQGEDAYIINVAGQQRMLSQRIALLAEYQNTLGGFAEELESLAVLFERNHNYLVRLDNAPAEAMTIYFGDNSLDSRVRSFAYAAVEFAQQPKIAETDTFPPSPEIIKSLLVDLNNVVNVFEQQSIQQTERLYKIETAIWLLTLLLLILEVILIFEPVCHRQVRK